jgi:hypothetical protein
MFVILVGGLVLTGEIYAQGKLGELLYLFRISKYICEFQIWSGGRHELTKPDSCQRKIDFVCN